MSPTARLKGASGESKGLHRYDKENILWQFTVAIRSDPVGSNQVFANKIHNMINELEKGKRKVVCCPKTHLCNEKTATFFGRPANLGTGDREFANKIVICPPAFHDLSKWGGCGCLMVHELLHALGFDLQLEDESGMFPGTIEKVEKGNRERENGMVYLARYLLGKACKGYDVWED